MPFPVKCAVCGSSFYGRTTKSRYCSDECKEKGHKRVQSAWVAKYLKKKQKAEKEPRRVRKAMSIDDVNKWVEKHYAKTGELLSYGKAVARMEMEVAERERRSKKKEAV